MAVKIDDTRWQVSNNLQWHYSLTLFEKVQITNYESTVLLLTYSIRPNHYDTLKLTERRNNFSLNIFYAKRSTSAAFTNKTKRIRNQSRNLMPKCLPLQIENLEDLLKEKDNQVDMARARLTAMQAHHCSSEGALSSLEEAIGDKEKQMAQLREQRDRAEQDKQEERELHERELAEYKMKIHALESEVSPRSNPNNSHLCSLSMRSIDTLPN